MERETLQKELIGLFEETAGCKFNKNITPLIWKT